MRSSIISVIQERYCDCGSSGIIPTLAWFKKYHLPFPNYSFALFFFSLIFWTLFGKITTVNFPKVLRLVILSLLYFTVYKCLKNIDINTQDRIEGLLSQKSYSLGGWREIASEYGMDRLKINYLENDPEAGKKTLVYLGSSNPDLTVYKFCRTLKRVT